MAIDASQGVTTKLTNSRPNKNLSRSKRIFYYQTRVCDVSTTLVSNLNSYKKKEAYKILVWIQLVLLPFLYM
jgi:hypothetical protein